MRLASLALRLWFWGHIVAIAALWSSAPGVALLLALTAGIVLAGLVAAPRPEERVMAALSADAAASWCRRG